MSEVKGTITEVTVPHLAETLVSATVGKWLKQPGDQVEQYDVLCELFTDKVNIEMPCPIEGKLLKILIGEGEEAAVGQAICLVEVPVSAEEAAQIPAPSDGQPTATEGVPADGSMRNRYSPAVQRLAAEHGIDLNRVPGTGLGGRITRKDVETYIQNGHAASAKVAGQTVPGSQVNLEQKVSSNTGWAINEPLKQKETPVRTSGIHLSETPPLPHIEIEEANRGETLIDVTPMRNTIATRMRQSVSEIPHAWTMIEVDVTNLVQLRNKVKDEFKRREGINLTYLAFLLKAVVGAIKDYPIMNSVWAVDKIIVKRDINLSLAVGTEDSVMTPVIQKADQKNIAGLAQEIDDLTKRARAGKLSLNDMQGGTFTINNTGSFGSILSYPIINYPQAAILTFESIVKKPVVIQDMIAVRSMVNLCLSLDHRILDGVICGRFLQRVKENLESYNLETSLY
ncbi:dihydrolipoamide acetyltransferase family protein [Paenibacillus larvae]|uniref:Dihydrolipoamide acetyltransferase component of pyruvate dehydrogenase complex n=3 Tax=Paenibacillus larvae TaxID=1464 RepID=V9W549_9BACL|nr:dihydrolipoamide acetyltransferase family protein [Paenibacillus larvae]AHD05089.1 branched-chain alpha-keto acid dehydrogenase component lipoamide acyltransferase [Paenibacillus larvae subsp. larvae DSM 25430]AQR76168.1 branched-chain alpha-keto acid dehydrogenase subunit E2 [Paenibacillus larvae subsp. larvae]AVF23071.1 branched-chain alpha-keto acid dehydrogenase component lipoamide acyltransferase [Paenibacillus larvae subsp. larvae]AVG11634.1 branched-chain alpha-keto acid dehydrogenase